MGQKIMVDSVVLVGAQLQGRRLPLRPDGPPQQGQHAGRAGRAGPADAAPRTASTASPSTSTARAGTSARWRTTPCSPRPPRATSAAPGIGTFSDRLRDAVRGGGPFDDDPRDAGLRQRRVAPTPTAPRSTATPAEQARARPRHRPGPARAGRQPAGRSPSGQPPATTVRGDQVDYNGQPAGYADQPDEVDQLRRRPRQRDAVRLADLQAAGGDVDGRPGPDEHAVAGHHRARADAVVLARGRRPAAQQDPGPQQLRLAATGSTGSTGPAPTTASATACRPRPTTAPSGRTMKPLLANPALKPAPADVQTASRRRRRTCCGCGSPRRCSGWARRS